MAVVNPFQQINASLPPLAPEPALGFNPGDMDTSAPAQMPQGKRPQVFGPTPQDRQETMLSGRLEKDYQKDLHPFGTPENHPGTMGKIAHALSWATGGPNRRLMEESGIEGKLNKLAALQSEDTLRGAQAGNLNSEAGKNTEETAEMPGKTASEEGLQGAQEGNLESETEARQHPPEEWKAIPQVIGPNGEPVEIEGRSGKIRFGDVSGLNPEKQPKPNTPEQQYIDEYRQMHKGSTIAQAERAYTTDTQRPPQSIMLVPQAGGGFKAQNVTPGSTVAPGAQTPAGVNSVNTPTTTQRNAAGRAATVVAMAPEVLSEIDALAPKLGPVMGNWNAFYQGKVGMDDPDFAGLRTDLVMLSSAVALAHAMGRLPENLRQEFDHMINAPKQTPENLKAVISHVLPWLQKMQEQGQPNQTQSGGPPQGADVQVKGTDGKMYWGNSKTKEVLGPVQ